MSFRKIECGLCRFTTTSHDLVNRCLSRHPEKVSNYKIETFSKCFECQNIELSCLLDNCGGHATECPDFKFGPNPYTKATDKRLFELNKHFADLRHFGFDNHFLDNYMPLLKQVNDKPQANNKKTSQAILDLVDLQNYIIDERDV